MTQASDSVRAVRSRAYVHLPPSCAQLARTRTDERQSVTTSASRTAPDGWRGYVDAAASGLVSVETTTIGTFVGFSSCSGRLSGVPRCSTAAAHRRRIRRRLWFGRGALVERHRRTQSDAGSARSVRRAGRCRRRRGRCCRRDRRRRLVGGRRLRRRRILLLRRVLPDDAVALDGEASAEVSERARTRANERSAYSSEMTALGEDVHR